MKKQYGVIAAFVMAALGTQAQAGSLTCGPEGSAAMQGELALLTEYYEPSVSAATGHGKLQVFDRKGGQEGESAVMWQTPDGVVCIAPMPSYMVKLGVLAPR